MVAGAAADVAMVATSDADVAAMVDAMVTYRQQQLLLLWLQILLL